jgi:DNA-binding response OmpR family regulator
MGRPAYPGPPLGNGQYILIVDDEIQVADLTARRLEKHNYHVVKKTNSREALEYFASNSEQFSLMIIDQVIPDLEGLDLAREALKIKPDLPIIMMTGYSSGITEKKCNEHGVGYLAMKPIDEKELATIVAHALRLIQPEKRL